MLNFIFNVYLILQEKMFLNSLHRNTSNLIIILEGKFKNGELELEVNVRGIIFFIPLTAVVCQLTAQSTNRRLQTKGRSPADAAKAETAPPEKPRE